MTKTLIEQLTAVITAIAQDISNNSGNSGGSSSDATALLPPKIGEKWYQKGLRYAADYPYPYSGGTVTPNSGWQHFIPFTALEDATITELGVLCTTAKSGATVSFGIYASDSNNDISNPLFTSAPMDCGTTGAKNATCNVQITKGKVYWLSSLVIGSAAFTRNYNELRPIKGNTTPNQPSIIGYNTSGNSSMAQSAPTNKSDMANGIPRVMFKTG